ncbi:MAG: hypothetical protein IJJ23_00300 [Clostridia bacterium]|nr:hypothetical protein [Clostridia bacterium]
MIKKVLKTVCILLAAVIIIAAGYVAYVFISYHRLPNTDAALTPEGGAAAAGRELTAVTWNVGFGAYSADYSFFMDGGTESRAYSREAAVQNIAHAGDVLSAQDADFILLQEVDFDSTRTYHLDERKLLQDTLSGYQTAFAQNYDSPYLFYPFLKPHGASKSGIMTLSLYGMDRFSRVSLPVETGVMKIVDLDRCYSKAYVEVEGGKTLCLFNAHLSAYTSDGNVATEQLAPWLRTCSRSMKPETT